MQMQKLKFENDNKEQICEITEDDEFQKLTNKYISMLFSNSIDSWLKLNLSSVMFGKNDILMI